MIPRYAIYYAPSAAHPMSMAASAWLGRDAFTNSVCERPALVGLDGIDLDQLTQDARHYGFHATLKAPFELHPERDEASLLSAFRALTARHAPFQADIQVAALGPFLAFVLAERSSQMQALHQAQGARRRAEEVRDVEAMIVEIGAQFAQVAGLVAEQGDTVQRIDADAEEALANVGAGHSELAKYFESVQRNRGLILKMLAATAFVVLLFAVFRGGGGGGRR
jgi:hypothetical protein